MRCQAFLVFFTFLQSWSLVGLIHDDDLSKIAALPAVDPMLGNEDGAFEMEEGWDAI